MQCQNNSHNLEICLIRHAESEVNRMMDNTPPEEQILAGATFWAQLTDKGIMQSRILGRYLREKNISFDKLAVSPYIRTQQTLRYCMEEIVGSSGIYTALSKVEVATDLREHFQGDWEGMRKGDIGLAEYNDTIFTDPERFYTSRFPGGESPEEVGARAAKYIQESILNKGFERVGLFTHRGTITWLLYGLFNVPMAEIFKQSARSASLTSLYFNPDGPCCYETNKFFPVTDGK